MKEIFKSWKAMNKAINDENTVWYQRMVMGEEVLVYKNRSRHLLLSDEPVDAPDWIEVVL